MQSRESRTIAAIRRRNAPPQSVGTIVESVLAQRGYLSVCREQQAMILWPDLVGQEVAKVTECTRVENGVLYVRVATAPWRQELSYMKRLIVTKIKKQCASITDIVFG